MAIQAALGTRQDAPRHLKYTQLSLIESQSHFSSSLKVYVPILPLSSAALVQPRLEGQPPCLACGTDSLGVPLSQVTPSSGQPQTPHRALFWFGSILLYATGAEGSSLKPDFLGSGQRSMTILARLGCRWGCLAARFAAGFDSIIPGRRKGRALVFAVCQPSCRDLTDPPGPGCACARVLPLSLAHTRKRAQEILKVTATE